MKIIYKYLPIILPVIGFMDSLYLMYEHFSPITAPCGTGILSGCNAVLESSYAYFFGVPLAVWGVVHYGVLTYALFLAIKLSKDLWKKWVIGQASVGFFMSFYLLFLQVAVIKSICIFCLLSALVSIILFVWAYKEYKKYLYLLLLDLFYLFYKNILKNIFFLFDAELVHKSIVNLGERIGKGGLAWLMKPFNNSVKDKILKQKISGINFESPIGLAAGFDYEARLTQTLSKVGFGFMTVGTITNKAYEGNKKPRLGRLPKSKSLMVNKGFKNLGAEKTAENLQGLSFDTPVGISIGVTNDGSITTLKEALDDIKKAFVIFEKSNLKNKYYELNISCPNLAVDISFYKEKNLSELLNTVDKLKLAKPYFVKMPIEKGNEEFLKILKVINKSKASGVIIGNLQKNRKDKSIDRREVEKFKVGNFSGKPTFERSNELIQLTYRKYKDRFIIIGCGGVFSAEDAYIKIKNGASLVQLITGMIYEGPQLVWQINYNLARLLRKDGYKDIKEAVGASV